MFLNLKRKELPINGAPTPTGSPQASNTNMCAYLDITSNYSDSQLVLCSKRIFTKKQKKLNENGEYTI